MTNATAKTEFKTSKGARVVVTAELVLEKTHYADGDNICVSCCEMGLVRADIDGFSPQTGFYEYASAKKHPDGFMLHGEIGRLGLTAENLSLVKSAIAELKQHPAWVAKQGKIEKNRKEIAAMEAERDNTPGYCRKCGTYCYGDCEAN